MDVSCSLSQDVHAREDPKLQLRSSLLLLDSFFFSFHKGFRFFLNATMTVVVLGAELGSSHLSFMNFTDIKDLTGEALFSSCCNNSRMRTAQGDLYMNMKQHAPDQVLNVPLDISHRKTEPTGILLPVEEDPCIQGKIKEMAPLGGS